MQAPSLAMLFIKSATTAAEMRAGQKLLHGDVFGRLVCEGICRFADGHLPGNLGDTPEALCTGEGGEMQVL